MQHRPEYPRGGDRSGKPMAISGARITLLGIFWGPRRVAENSENAGNEGIVRALVLLAACR